MKSDGDSLSFNEAIAVLRQRKRGSLTVNRARLMLISALREGQLVAFASEYCEECDLRKYSAETKYDFAIPAGFWHELQSEDFDNTTGFMPTAPHGNWQLNCFTLAFSQYAYLLALRFPNFSDIAWRGTEVASYWAIAKNCTVFRLDIDRLAKRSANGVIEAARRKPFWPTGNLKASDKERLSARICAISMITAGWSELADSSRELEAVIRKISLWDDHKGRQPNVSDDYYRRFSELIGSEMRQIIEARGAP